MNKKKALEILNQLSAAYPDAECALHHENVFQLLCAVAMSAQTTDESVNKVTPALFSAYPDAQALAKADPAEVSEYIRTIGLYKNKSKNLVAMAQKLVEDFDGQVPRTDRELTSLPGVGRKTANVVQAVGFGEQRIAVDTHVFRVSNRIGLVKEENVLKTELSLQKILPRDRWTEAHHALIFHGRRCCMARKPNCEDCPIGELCEKHL